MAVRPLLIRSKATTQFTDQIAADASELETLTVHTGGRELSGKIGHITIVSKENLPWEVSLFTDGNANDTDPDKNTFVDREAFTAANGIRFSGAGLYHYAKAGLGINYYASDGNIRVRLVNPSGSGATKSAGATGALVIGIGFDPRP